MGRNNRKVAAGAVAAVLAVGMVAALAIWQPWAGRDGAPSAEQLVQPANQDGPGDGKDAPAEDSGVLPEGNAEIAGDDGSKAEPEEPGAGQSGKPLVAHTREELAEYEAMGFELAFPQWVDEPEREEPETYIDPETGETIIRGIVCASFRKEVGEQRMREIVAEVGCEVDYITPQKAWQYLDDISVDLKVPKGMSEVEIRDRLKAMPEVSTAFLSTVVEVQLEG